DVDEGVALPRRGATLVDPATPDVDDGLTVDEHRDAGAEVGTTVEVVLEHLAYARIALVALAANLGRAALGSHFLGHCPSSDRYERMNVMPAEPLAPVQKAELQQHTHTDDVATGSLHQPDRGFDSAPGGEHVIDDQHAISRRERPVLHLNRRLGVLELVGGPVRHTGQLALLAHRHESGAEVVRNRRRD